MFAFDFFRVGSMVITTKAEGASGSGAQDCDTGPGYVVSKYGTRQLVLKQHTFNRHVNREDVTYWRCSQFAVLRCRARIKTNGSVCTVLNGEHNHEVITKTRKYGSLKAKIKGDKIAGGSTKLMTSLPAIKQ